MILLNIAVGLPLLYQNRVNLDPKTWCRFPILSGGYKKELEEMKDKLKNK